MRHLFNGYARIATITLVAGRLLSAQEPNPTQRPPGQTVQVQTVTPVPIFRIEVVERTTQAVNYLHRGGSTKIDFKGTPLMASGSGSAKVESQRGVIDVAADFKDMVAPSTFGPEYLTYVLWAISPDGRAVNLGELTLSDYGNGSHSKIETSSDIQTFGMIVTAEPYYGVTQPSDVVVMENIARPDTRGVVESINAKYELLPRGSYTKAGGFVPLRVSKKDPLELYEAENAVQIARLANADKYAGDSFQKANDALTQARRYQNQKPGQKPVITMSREAVVRAEDARVIAMRREREERAENERQASIARENAEKQNAEAARVRAEEQARLRAQADSERIAAENAKADAERAKADAERAKREAETAAVNSDRLKREAEEARQAALAQQQQLADEAGRARAAAADADRLRADADRLREDAERQRQKAEEEQAQVRQQLLTQFNAILQTRDTTRGLIVNMSDVLFDTGQYTLKPGAREKLARVAGIILGHPGLKIAVEGHTDSVGGDQYNLKLSENRANTVRAYLISQSIDPAVVTATGFGKTNPVADNSTAAGRQMNRRVEMVVSGEILGTTVSDVRTSSTTTKH
ncbi:MAG: OmpA/MotB domain protein [Bryobacterales bacterium]|nr:OmpA/MotB domain protein [Bryobacterales bacterium]